MATSVNWSTRRIFVPKADLTPTADPDVFELNADVWRFELRALEAARDEGITAFVTHDHATDRTLAGTTYAPQIEIINGYRVEFEDGQYAVSIVGANTNVPDVVVLNQVSVRSNNSAGLQVVSVGSGLSAEQAAMLEALYQERFDPQQTNPADGTQRWYQPNADGSPGAVRRHRIIYETVDRQTEYQGQGAQAADAIQDGDRPADP